MKSIHASILAAAVLALSTLSCGGKDGGNPAGPGGSTPDVTITIVGNVANAYSPDPDTVTAGQTVAWRNSNGTQHTATSDNGTTFDTNGISPGSRSAAIQMNTPGSYDYHCTIHPGMTGTLVVLP